MLEMLWKYCCAAIIVDIGYTGILLMFIYVRRIGYTERKFVLVLQPKRKGIYNYENHI